MSSAEKTILRTIFILGLLILTAYVSYKTEFFGFGKEEKIDSTKTEQEVSSEENNKIETSEESSESGVEKFLGYWKATDGSELVLRIFYKEPAYKVSDGENEIYIRYKEEGDKFIVQEFDASQDIEIRYSDNSKQISWVIIQFGDDVGKVRRTYDFIK